MRETDAVLSEGAMTILAAFAGPAPAPSGAELAGAVFALILILGGALKCAAIARRPEASGLCAYGLMLVLLGWMTSGLQHVLVLAGYDREPVLRFLGFGLLTLGILLVLAGGLTALVGLLDYGRHPEYRQGRVQAAVAVAFAGLVVAAAFVGMAASLVKGVAEIGSRAAESPPAPPDPIVVPELNLQYRTPPPPWVQWDARKLNKDVTFGLMRRRPALQLMVIAEKTTGEMDTPALAEIAKANLRSSSSRATLGEDQAWRVNGMDGTRFLADAKVGEQELSYVFWVCARRGYVYQAFAFASQKDRDALHREANDLFARLSQIDPGRDAGLGPPRPLEAYRSDELGLALDASGSGWMEWRDRPEQHPEAAVGGIREEDGGFLVTPFLLEAETPSPEAVVQAALKEWGITYPSPAVSKVTKRREGDVVTVAFQLERKVDERDYAYRMKVFVGKGRGAFVGVWSRSGFPGIDRWTSDLLRRLQLRGPRPDQAAGSLPEPVRLYHARLHNRIGLYYFTAKDYRTAAPHFQVATRLDPKERVYLTNALDAFNRDSRARDAMTWLGALDKHPLRRDDVVQAWEAWFLKQDHQVDRALAVYRQLFAGAYRGDDDFRSFAGLLAEAGRPDELAAAYDRYLGRAESVELRLEEARLLGKAGRHAQALRMLERLQKSMPPSAEVSFARLEHHRELGQHRQRVALCEELIRSGLASAEAYYQKGDAEVKLKWYRRAKDSLEQALKLTPDDEDLKEYVQYVSGLLGEGNNSAVKDALPAVALPATLAAQIGRLAPATGPSDFGASYVYWTDGYSWDEKGELRTTVRQRIHVADQAGVEQFSTLEIDFNPLGEEVYVNELAVRDIAGTVVARGQTADSYVIDRQGNDVASHAKTLYLPVPGLAPGHLLDLTYTRRELGRTSEFPFQAIPLGAELPVQLRAVFVLADTSRLVHKASPGLQPEAIPGGLLFRAEKPPAYPREPSRVSPLRTAPAVWLGGRGAQWPALAREYLQLIQPKLGVSAQVDALARRLIAGKKDRQHQVASLLDHVRAGYVYKPIEFGRRARVPNSAADTLGRKYGDCKDLSVLLHGLLRAAGVDSRLALVHTREELQKDLPSLDQFNHMIVFVPDPQGAAGRFYDPTDQWLSMRQSPPLALASAEALVLDPAAPRIERLGPYAPESSTVRVTRRVRIDRDRGLAVTESLELTGYHAASLRDYLVTLDARRQRQWVQGVLAEVGRGAHLDAFAAKDVRAAEPPLVLELSYRLPERCSAEGPALRCALPASWEGYYLGVTPVPERRTPFEIEYPLRLTSRTTVEGSPGCSGLELEILPPAAPSEFLRWTTTHALERGAATLRLEATLATGTFPAARYRDYFRQSERAIRSAGRSVTCNGPPAASR